MSTLLVASNAKELATAQTGLIAETEAKLQGALDDARAAERMKDQMIAARLAPGQARQIHRRATARVSFLTRVKVALEAGYCMMPDMPGEVIAVRTDRDTPRTNETRWREGGSWNVPDHTASANLPAGQGRYVSPAQGMEKRTVKVTRKRHDGTTYEDDKTEHRAIRLRDPDGLHRRFVRPEVVDRTTAAMLRGIFDEIVCVRPTDTRRRSRDPIVLGRIVSGRTVAAFLIAWFVDPAEL